MPEPAAQIGVQATRSRQLVLSRGVTNARGNSPALLQVKCEDVASAHVSVPGALFPLTSRRWDLNSHRIPVAVVVEFVVGGESDQAPPRGR